MKSRKRVFNYDVVGVTDETFSVRIIKQSHRCWDFKTKKSLRTKWHLESCTFPECRVSNSTFYIQGSNKKSDKTCLEIPHSYMKDFIILVDEWVRGSDIVVKPAKPKCVISGKIVTIDGKKYKLSAVK
jgi:hypothetical protein